MHFKAIWNYANKGLLLILGLLIISSLASIIFLAHSLVQLNSSLKRSGGDIGAAFVLQDLLINLQTVESGSRGFIITGDRDFIRDYNTAYDRVERDLATLQNNNELGLSEVQVNQISSLIKQKLQFIQTLIETRDSQGALAAALLVQDREGENLMLDLRQQIIQIASSRLQDIGPRQRLAQDKVQRALMVAVAMGIFVFGACSAVMWYFQRAILRERALEHTKSEFLSLASHQLRTPATNVKQYIGMLLDGYMGDLTEEQRAALKIAYKNNESEISIMNNLLDVAKLDLDKIQLNKQPVNLSSLARHIVAGYQQAAAEHRQTLRMEGAKNIRAMADATYIRGVIENLVDNAIKYSKEDTEIIVMIARDDNEAVITVKDQGLGIRKRDFGKLFNKFSRLTNDYSANSQGSGLGLYWVKQIVSLHGGKIIVSSKEGRGSTFTVRLPIK